MSKSCFELQHMTGGRVKVRVGFPLCEAMSCGSVTGGSKKRAHDVNFIFSIVCSFTESCISFCIAA